MVHARQTVITNVMKAPQQMRVPMYQRRYAWKRPEWDALWDDIARLADDLKHNPHERHFMGSVVLTPVPGKASSAMLVIDGQQRLITLSLLLAAIRDSDADLSRGTRRRIGSCLQRPAKRGRPAQRLRLVPTQLDTDAFARIMLGQEPEAGHHITRGYHHFARRLRDLSEDIDESVGGLTVDELTQAALDGLDCVQVTATPKDNVHRIFESLNNRGMELTQADLIRNYVFMQLNSEADDFHTFTWMPLEQRFSADELTQLFWLDLVRDRPTITQRQTYVEQQKRMHGMTAAEIRKHISRISKLGEHWELILHPEKESSIKVRRRLERLREWKTTTAQPILMYLLERRAQGKADVHETARAMHYLESYFVRRVVMGRATMNMNRVLLAAPRAISRSRLPVDQALRHYLSESGKHWASDDELRREVATKAFYNHGKSYQKTLILKWIEESLSDMEYDLSEDLTIEHVMPQSLNPAWRAELKLGARPGEDINMLHGQLVHTLGNLTLTMRNSELSNKSFDDKKRTLKKHGSGLKLTGEITKKAHWGPVEIRARSRLMVDRIIKTWPGPQ